MAYRRLGFRFIIIIGAIAMCLDSSLKASEAILPQGLPDYGQFGQVWGVVPRGAVIRLTNSGLGRMAQQVGNLLVQPSMRKQVSKAILQAGDLDQNCVGCDYPNDPSDISCSRLYYASAGARECLGPTCAQVKTGFCEYSFGCGCVPACPCNEVWQVGCTCFELASQCENLDVWIRDEWASGLSCPDGYNPVCDEEVLYYNRADVSLTPNLPNGINVGITFLNDGNACRSTNNPNCSNPVTVANLRVNLWGAIGDTFNTNLSTCSINASATITPIFSQVSSI